MRKFTNLFFCDLLPFMIFNFLSFIVLAFEYFLLVQFGALLNSPITTCHTHHYTQHTWLNIYSLALTESNWNHSNIFCCWFYLSVIPGDSSNRLISFSFVDLLCTLLSIIENLGSDIRILPCCLLKTFAFLKVFYSFFFVGRVEICRNSLFFS